MNTFRRLEINQDVLTLATQWVRRYSLSHHLRLADAVIATSAVLYDIPRLTPGQNGGGEMIQGAGQSYALDSWVLFGNYIITKKRFLSR